MKNKTALKGGTYSIVLTAIVLAILVVVNIFAQVLPSSATQYDISSTKLYSITSNTKVVVNALEEDVTIYWVVQNGKEDDVIEKLLDKYDTLSDRIKIKKKNPDIYPTFTKKYTSDEVANNSLIVECGDRNRYIAYSDIYVTSGSAYSGYSGTTSFDGEGAITSAIDYVVNSEQPKMYILNGHGEAELSTTFNNQLTKENIETEEFSLLTTNEVPDDADFVLINAPSSDISEEEKTELLDYLEAGGKAMIFSDYTQDDLPNFDAVLENYGVKCAEGIVFEGDNQHYGMQMPYYLVPTVNSTDASSETASAGSYVLAPYAQGIQKTDDVRDTVTIDSILTTSDKAYSKTNMQSSNIEKEDGDVDGPFDLGVAITEKLDDDKETQIVYYSTANLMESQVNQMVSGGNEKLLLESLNWMTSTDDGNSVSIPSKSLESTSLTVTDYDAAFWKICTIGLIPGVFLVAGFLIWLKRRKA